VALIRIVHGETKNNGTSYKYGQQADNPNDPSHVSILPSAHEKAARTRLDCGLF
jgi:hypothetical protein